MLAVWRAIPRRLQRLYSSSAQAPSGDYIFLYPVDDEALDNDDDREDAPLNSFHHSSSSQRDQSPVRQRRPAKRRLRRPRLTSYWRSKLRQGSAVLALLILLVLSPFLVKFLHLYSDPGYDDKFLNPLYHPHPSPIEHLVPPVSVRSLPRLPQSSRRDAVDDSAIVAADADLLPQFDDLSITSEHNDDAYAARLGLLLPGLVSELDTRLQTLSHLSPPLASPTSNLTSCPSLSSPAFLARYGHLASPSRGRTLIGLNLFNSAPLLPTLARSLLALAQFLGPQSILVSIFENGSTDGTREGLAHLAAILSAAGIPHRVVSDEAHTPWENVDRISQLALYRNVVLDALRASGEDVVGLSETAKMRGWEDVMFINDVYWCPTDALELMHVRKAQRAHAACGLDWRWKKLPMFGAGPKFYDNWVTRSLKGNTLRSRLDIFSEMRDGVSELFYVLPDDAAAHERLRMGRVLPVYSCWNGMIGMDARPFLGVNLRENEDEDDEGETGGVGWHDVWGTDGLEEGIPDEEFNVHMGEEEDGVPPSEDDLDVVAPPMEFEPESQTRLPPVRFRGAQRDQQECAASECKLVAKDFWRRGFNRWVLVPYVRTTYEWDLYNSPDLEALSTRAQSRWRASPASLSSLPASPARLEPSWPALPDAGWAMHVAKERATWAFPDARTHFPHESTPFDEFAIPGAFNVTFLPSPDADADGSGSGWYSRRVSDPLAEESEREEDASSSSSPSSAPHPSAHTPSRPYPPPSIPNDSAFTMSPILREGGEELDLLAWSRIEGPETVVCWPYHGVGGRHVEWWWTAVVEKVGKRFAHLRR